MLSGERTEHSQQSCLIIIFGDYPLDKVTVRRYFTQQNENFKDFLRLLGADHVAVFGAYFDESGTNGQSPFVVVAGFVSSANEWIEFNRKWNERLRLEGIPYFHAKDFFARVDIYKKWNEKKREEFIKTLIHLMHEHTTLNMFTFINKTLFRSIAKTKAWKKINLSEYQSCCFHVILAFHRWAERKPNVNQIAYFFEAGQKVSREMHDIFDVLRDSRQFPKLGPISFPTKEQACPLQTGDFLAHLIQKFCVAPKEFNPELKKLLLALFQKGHSTFQSMEREAIERLFDKYLEFRAVKRAAFRNSFPKPCP